MKEIRELWMITFKIFLELIRIIILFSIIGCVMWGGARLIYTSFDINVDGSYAGWLGGIAIYSLLFVLYRNKLQFSGFYNGPYRQKLSPTTTTIFITISVFLLILPLFWRPHF
ncbi:MULTISPECIES: hypothetical protein [Lysinibacillus]|uniref:hypothetical protein n=1 Tax=Lysinibacillus TaxID=400634 RepID=UPI002152650A|nr:MULTISPECIES: hypothetical protein [Lysinibacillus]MCR6522388.1 hypothetical protein [Lysinibacillus capsici]MCS5499559.1 hypothetical protein [Lysinibacillus sp. A4]MEC1304884.1 hypothetical protein [Lysinibacillus capsici]